MQTQLALFDYSQLDAPTRSFVEQRTSEIRMLGRRMSSDIVGIGQRLAEIKSRLGHGKFGAWLEYEFAWTDRTAQRFMRVADAFKSDTVSDLDIQAKALYLLAAPSTPEDARQEAIERAENGETITHAVAQEIVEEHKDEPEEEPEEDTPPEPEQQPQRFVCPDCGEIFQGEVWHCAYCHSHWALAQDRCLGCDHKAATTAEKKVLAILEQQAPDLLEQVRTGDLSITQARREMVKRQKQEPPPIPDDKYRVWYADPPWYYTQVIDGYGPAERHYPTMQTPEICALGEQIKSKTTKDAVLFLWSTAPKLKDALEVAESWGFRYTGAQFIWDKVKHNYGHYNSVRHELLLICVKGSCTPDSKQLFDSVQTIERSNEHSEKPEEFRRIIEELYTYGKRIELFARVTAEGWDTWGNEPGQQGTS